MLARPIASDQGDNHRVSEGDIGRLIPQPARPAPPAPPKPVVVAPPPRSDKVKVTIVQGGEAKEFSVIRSDTPAPGASLDNAVELNPAPVLVPKSSQELSRAKRVSNN